MVFTAGPVRRDVEQSSHILVDKLGFAEVWRHVEDGKALVAEVDRAGCELILSCQWPEQGRLGADLRLA